MEPDNKKPQTPSHSGESPQPPKAGVQDTSLRALRTYRDDVAFALGKNKTSLVDISVAEHKRDMKHEELLEKELALKERIEEEGIKIRAAEKELKKAERFWLSWFKQKPKVFPSPPEEKPEPPRPPVKPSPPKAPPPPPPVSVEPQTLRYQTESEYSMTPGTLKPKRQLSAGGEGAELSSLEQSKKHAEKIRAELEQRQARLRMRIPIRFQPARKESQFFKYFTTLITIILFIGGGVGLGILGYTNFKNMGAVEPEATIPTFFPVNLQQEIQTSELSPQNLMRALTEARDRVKLSSGDMAHLYLIRNLAGQSTLLSTSEFFTALRLRAPAPLIRTLNENFMLGIHKSEKREPFLVLETTFFENAFPGMIVWEPFMNEDLAPLFGAKLDTPLPVAFLPTAPSPFIDLVINNKDARVLYGDFGDIILLYAFVDRGTIIITTNQETFLEIFKRMTGSRTVR